MKKILLLFLLVGLFSVNVNAQGTVLAPGDVAIVQYQSDTPDAFAFVTFVDLVAGTTIYFTDCGATPGTGTFLNPCTEGAKKYIVGPSGATAGDMFFFEDGGGDPLFTTHTDAGILGSFALGTTGDQILVFQDTDGTGGTDPILNPTFLFAINGASTGWTGDPSTSSSHTSLPTGLVDGTTAIAVGAGSGPSDEVDNSVFNTLGMPFATVAAAKAAILNTANWFPAGDDSEVTYAGYVAALIAQGNLLGSAIVCPTVGAVSPSETSVCVNDPFNITATGLITMDGTSNMEQDFGIEFKFFGSATADPYTGGTSLGTVPFGSLTGGNTTAALVGASIPFVDPTGFMYAVLSPTPTDGTCRPSAVTTISSQSAPSIDVTLPETYCLDEGIVTNAGPLVAPTAASTVFSGANVIDNGDNNSFTFDVPTAGAGVHPVTVTLTNANNCTTVVIVNVTVIETTATLTAPADLCVNAGVQANLGGGTPSQGTITGDMGVYSGPGVSDNGNGMTYNFDPATAGVGTHTLFYAYTDENGCTGTGSDMVQVFASPTVTFTAPADACVNDIPVTALNGGGSPAGGVYSGPGVTDSGDGMGFTFDPGSAGVGVHTITYTVGAAGCSGSAMDDIEVFGLPTTTMTTSADFCEDAGVQTSLSGGTPTGGIYSGTAVTDDANGMTYTFDPAAAGSGVHTVFYNFTDTNGCTGSGSDLVEVFALPTIEFTALPDLCLNDPVVPGQGGATPFGGVYMGPGVTDDANGFTYEFDPAAAGVGVQTLSYQFTDTNGCTGTGTDMVEVFDIPNPMFSAPADLCISAGVQLGLGGGTPMGGVYSGSGVVDGGDGMTYNFDPGAAGVGTHTITYTVGASGCSNSAMDDIEVFAIPTIVYSAPDDLCIDADELVDIGGGTPMGGMYVGPGVTDDANGMTYDFDPAVAGVGTHVLIYFFTDTNGCTGSGSDLVEVFALPVVTLDDPGDFCLDAGNIKNLSGGAPLCGPPPFAGAEICEYAGPGVTDNGNGTYDFNTMDAGVGVHELTYTFTDMNGCSNTASVFVEVFALPVVTFTAPTPDVCISDPVQTGLGGGMPVGGVYSGTGVSDDGNGMTFSFDPTASAPAGGNVPVIYTFTDANGCTGSVTDYIYVNPICCMLMVTCPTGPVNLSCIEEVPALADAAAILAEFTAQGGTVDGSCNPVVITFADTDDAGPGCVAAARTITRTFTVTDPITGETEDCPIDYVVVDATPPVITCPANVTVGCTDSTDPADTGMATATDNCSVGGALAITFVDASTPDVCAEYVISRTWTATDACGNTAACSQLITVEGPAGPTITCPADVITACDASTDPADTGMATGTADCNLGFNITFVDLTTQGMGCAQNEYVITRTWTNTDACGTMAVCTQTITVEDNTPPVITCPANLTVGCIDSTDPMDTGEATATDNCGGGAAPAPSVWINEFHYDNAGTDAGEFVEVAGTAGFDLSTCEIILYNGSNGTSYNTISLSGTIDDEGMGFGAVSFLQSGLQNGAPDGLALVCGGVVIEFLSYEGTITATNGPASGMTSVDVGVSETSGTPAGQSLQLEGTGAMAADFTWAGPAVASAGDLNANQNIVVPPAPAGPAITFVDASTPDVCAEYIITRTWTATDACGNTAVCTQLITVEGPDGPAITCPADVTIECDASTDPANTGMATGTADCNLGFNITFSDASTQGTTGCSQYEYEITRTWTNTDDCGNTAVCTQLITVEDATPPVIECPANATVQCDQSTDPADTGEATATDNCSTSGGGSPAPVIWINEFHYDNASTDVNEFVEVAGTAGFDLSNCVIVLYNGNGGGSYNTIPLSGTIDDESMGYGAVSFSQPGIQNGSPDGLALVCGGVVVEFLSYEGTFMASDGPAAGMTSVDIGIAEAGDSPVGLSVQLQGTGSLAADFTWTGPVAESPGTLNTDQIIALPSGPVETVVTFSDVSTQGQGCSAYSYTIIRTWTATDACGNTSTCSQIVTVEDTTAPVITCPADVTVECDQPTDPAATGTASGVDNCAGSSGGDPVVWINEFHYDNAGTDVGEFVEIAGTAAFDLSACQVVLYNGSNGTSYNTIVLSGAIDNESNGFGALSFAQAGIQNGSPDGLALVCNGTVVEFISYEGSFTATDGPAAGMTSTNVGVSETSGTPVGQSLQLGGSGNMAADFAWEAPAAESPGSLNANQTITVSSNGEIAITFVDVSTQTPTGCSNDSYTITRTWTAADPCGNTAQCVQVITVEDTTPPTIICPANTTIECDEDTDPTNTGTAVAVDDCAAAAEIVITFVDASTQETTGCGQYQYQITRTWTATDPCGNTTNCVQVIEVEDTTAPEIVCPADVTLACTDSTDPGDTGTATGSDNCSAVAEVVITSSDITTQGTEGCAKFTYNILRTWLATDACGNTTTCVQSIDVADTEPPVVTCPPSQTLTCFETLPAPAMNAADFIALGGTISDNCTSLLSDFTVFTQNSDNGGDNCPGNAREVVRTYFIQDACGNTTTCEQTFTYLESTQGPVITSILPSCFKYCSSLANPMESDVTYETDCSFDATVNITGPTQIGADNCPGTIYRYTYTVTDDCGRTSAPVTRDFIIGNDGPTIECPAFNLLLECGDPNNSDYIAAHAGLVTANSSCDSDVTINYFPQNFNNFACNTSTVVTFVATDACGRTASCTTTVNISDNTAPVITSVYEDGICNEAVCGSDLNFWYNAWKDKVMEGLSATDACDTNVSISPQGPNTPNQNCPDETTETVVNFVATDNCGNTSYIPYSFYVTANDTPEPPQASSVSGMIRTEEMEAVEDVEVYLAGGASFFELFITANDGMYEFNNVPLDQNYTVTPLLDQFPMNGVTSFDLVLIAQHILSINELDSPYKMIAADINRSGSITTLDLVELRKMILYINTDFPNNTSWRFVDANFVFPDATNPFASAFPEIVNINGMLEAVENDFVGVKTGDVNGTAVANNLTGADDRSFNGDLPFNVKDMKMEAGETYEVIFSSDAFEAIAGYQYTLNFNTEMLEFVDVSAGDLTGMSEANFGLSLLNEGAITTSWTNDAPISMKGDAELFRITFKAKQATQLSEALAVNSRFTKAEAYDVNTENGQLNLLNVTLRFDDALSTKFTLMQNTPNPFSDNTVIGFVLPEATSATLTVFDVSGKQLKLINGDYEAGYNEVSLDRGDLAEGMLYYKLETTNNTATKKMLLINK